MSAGLFAQDAATLARNYAEHPTPANRTALARFAAAAKGTEGALALLALGAQDLESSRAEDAIPSLRAARSRLPKLADFASFLLASAGLAAEDLAGAAEAAEFVVASDPKSPVAGQAAIIGAKAYIASEQPARAVDLLRRVSTDLPQPEGDFNLAGAYEAASQWAKAAECYQRIWLGFPTNSLAKDAGAAVDRMRERLGDYPHPVAGALLGRAMKLMDARQYAQARTELVALSRTTTGAIHDLAAVRIGAAQYRARNDADALEYLASLDVDDRDAAAERLFYVVAAARRLGRLDTTEDALAELRRDHPKSDWLLQALVLAADEYSSTNRTAEAEPLYRECTSQFPRSTRAPYCDWKIAFAAYTADRADAGGLLRGHARLYPDSDKASAALYFVGRMAERDSRWAEARAFYDQVDRRYPNYYYAVLARERKSQSRIAAAQPDRSALAWLNAIPVARPRTAANFEPLPGSQTRFERARLLASVALERLAVLELRYGAESGKQPEAFGLELAREASARAAHDQAIRYLKRYAPGYLLAPAESLPDEFWRLAFPLPWREPLERYARDHRLDPFMVAALVRQESEFDPRAVSKANAYGLTQILPSTGRDLSRRVGIRGFRATMLFQPELNLRLGTYYLDRLLGQFEGRWEPALAAYNAGKTRADDWLRRFSFRDMAEFVEMIPFPETRNYVQVVIRNADVYRRLYSNP